ncbi:MAG: DUF2442 domain-containing protein [Methylococcales bacterium]|nr:MAG: DUF2442 domain-containing protein [Methylococcales bacterium]
MSEVTEDEIIAYLVDGRTVSVPLIWSWRLSEATEKQRQNFEIIGDGQGIHWPDLNQVILQLISENQAGIPLLMASFSTRKGYCKAHCTLGISILRRDSCSGLLWFGSCAKLQ